MPSSLLGAHPAAASGGETPDETKPDKEGWDKPGDEALSFKDRTTLRSTMVASFEAAIKGKSTAHLLYDGSRKGFAAWQMQLSMFYMAKVGPEAPWMLALPGQDSWGKLEQAYDEASATDIAAYDTLDVWMGGQLVSHLDRTKVETPVRTFS